MFPLSRKPYSELKVREPAGWARAFEPSAHHSKGKGVQAAEKSAENRQSVTLTLPMSFRMLVGHFWRLHQLCLASPTLQDHSLMKANIHQQTALRSE